MQLPTWFDNRINVATILVLLLVPVVWYVLYRTPFGLRLRAVGENPAAADAAGVNVIKLRYTAVIISGLLAAAGGAYLSIGQSSLFTRNMTAGRGFIALAALILAKWRPVPVLLACLFFGFTEALTNAIQGAPWAKMPSGEDIPIQFIQMIPYVLTIIVLAGFIGYLAHRKHWEYRIVKRASSRSECLLKDADATQTSAFICANLSFLYL
jgi:simple sugar transport system permease protein